MKPVVYLLAATLLLPALGAAAQAAPATPPALALASALPVAPTPEPPSAAHPSVYTRPLPGGASLTVFEAQPSRRAQDPQFAQLERIFDQTQPTLVLFESAARLTDSTADATIHNLGAMGYAHFLAQHAHVPAASLADPVAEYAHLRATTEAEPLKLYYLLRFVQRFQTRPDASKTLAKRAMKALIATSASFAPGTEQVIRNLAELRAAYHRYCPTGGNWWQAPASYSDDSDAGAGEVPFSTRIKQERAAFRAQAQASQLAQASQAGARVLLVVAPGHGPA